MILETHFTATDATNAHCCYSCLAYFDFFELAKLQHSSVAEKEEPLLPLGLKYQMSLERYSN